MKRRWEDERMEDPRMEDETMEREKKEHEPYGFMERELIFKLLASHALVDEEFFYRLREDPENAAAQLHIRLTDADIDYIKNKVEWDRIEVTTDAIRESLHLDLVTNSW
jgi:hypothetical protein